MGKVLLTKDLKSGHAGGGVVLQTCWKELEPKIVIFAF